MYKRGPAVIPLGGDVGGFQAKLSASNSKTTVHDVFPFRARPPFASDVQTWGRRDLVMRLGRRTPEPQTSQGHLADKKHPSVPGEEVGAGFHDERGVDVEPHDVLWLEPLRYPLNPFQNLTIS